MQLPRLIPATTLEAGHIPACKPNRVAFGLDRFAKLVCLLGMGKALVRVMERDYVGVEVASRQSPSQLSRLLAAGRLGHRSGAGNQVAESLRT